ncbi:MAG: DUF4831 family protein [Bacteroidales bacterium]|nr:DUF4831 family protein [Bacteroidales bacterium]
MKHIASIILASLCLSPVVAQQVQRVHIGDNQHYGITYSLPAVGLHVQAEAVCTTVRAGVFAQYAEKYLGLTNVPMEDQTVWTLKNVEMDPVIMADSSRTFHINFSEKVYAPTFWLGQQGQLVSINREPAVAAPLKAPAPDTPLVFTVDTLASYAPEMHSSDVLSEEMLKAGSRSKQAEIAARQIFRIRESRLNLLTGDVDHLPADGASFRIVLDHLKAQEAAYLELFTGVVESTTVNRSFEFRPREQGRQILFRFSSHFGFVEADDLSGEAVYMQVAITSDQRKVPAQLDAKGRAIPQATGIAHTVPGRARVAVSLRGEVLDQGEWPMGQFGHVEFLQPGQFTDKKLPTSAQFDPATGKITVFRDGN